MMEPIRVVLDVDTGVDDAMAIALAVAAPTVDLIGVTTVAGNVEIAHTTANTLRVLDFVGATQVPVYRGMTRPLDRPLRTAAWVHGTDGLGGADIAPSTRMPETTSAPQFLVDVARANPGALTFVFVGPLTNLAVALALEPELPRLVQRLVIMGGAFRVPGNTTPMAEFNIYADPQAAAQVVAAGFAATWIGLDVTMQTLLNRAQWEALEGATAPNAALVRMMGARMFAIPGRVGIALHDPLAMAVAIDPSLVDAPEERVIVDATHGPCEGATVLLRPNRHDEPIGAGSSTHVAQTVDADRFAALFAETLGLPK